MPKSRRVIAKGRPSVSQRVKFKIGGRKSNISALLLSTDQLMDKLTASGTRRRDIPRIQQALAMRGIVV